MINYRIGVNSYDYYLTKEDEKNMRYYQENIIGSIKNIKQIFELSPIDGRKSFYGRCKVIATDTKVYLLSYSTIVCYWDDIDLTFVKSWDGYSATTMRHINAFMRSLGFNLGGKKWWCSLEYNKKYSMFDILNIA